MLLNILILQRILLQKILLQPEKILPSNLESPSTVYELKNEYLNLYKNIIRHQDPISTVHIFEVY